VAAAAGLVGCSSSKNNNTSSGAKPASATSASTTTSGTPGVRATSAAPAAAVRTASPAAIDLTKGKPGGTLNITTPTYPPNAGLVDVFQNAKIAGLVMSGLLQYKSGKAGIDGGSIDVEPDVAAAMPEQPDPMTYTFKIRKDVKFQNGRALTAEDVR